MEYTLHENKKNSLWDLIQGMIHREGIILEDSYEKVVYTGTGRSALNIILGYLKAQGKITDKNTEVLISQWVCLSVYQMMHKSCFPTLTQSGNTKGILVYHQYGFPQDMDEILSVAQSKNWFVIENCVNVFESFYKSRKVGTFGLASIFSLSKMFPAIQGGAIVSNDDELISYTKRSIEKDHSSAISFLALISRFITESGHHPFWEKIQLMAYARIESAKKISRLSLNIVRKEMQDQAMKVRQQHYHFLLDYFKDTDIFRDLEGDVIPYVVPLITKEDTLEKIKHTLLSGGVWTDIYRFDVNRNMLNPDFKKCVWIPVHQGIKQSEMENICLLIKEVI